MDLNNINRLVFDGYIGMIEYSPILIGYISPDYSFGVLSDEHGFVAIAYIVERGLDRQRESVLGEIDLRRSVIDNMIEIVLIKC